VPPYQLLVRTFLIPFGCFAIGWGLIVSPLFWRQSSIDGTAQQIIRGEPFKYELLKPEIPLLDAIDRSTYCYPAELRGAAIVRLRIVEEAIASGERTLADHQLGASDKEIRSALSCSPADPYLWVALFWTDTRLNGFRPDYFQFLRMSYQLGPNEGWIALIRSHLTFAMFEYLPSDLREDALREFVGLLRAGLYSEAADIFTGPAWHVRDSILPRLGVVTQADREAFASVLYMRGVSVAIPGVAAPESRFEH
jgi:hypothetical protein